MELIGSLCSLGAAILWSISISLFRIYGEGRTAVWLNLFKGLVALLCFGLVGSFSSQALTLDLNVILVLAVSGFVGVLIGDCAFFMALTKIGSALTSAIQCLSPPLTAVLAWIVLGEELSYKQVVGLLITSSFLAFLLLVESKSEIEAVSSSVGEDASFFMIVFSKIRNFQTQIRNQSGASVYYKGAFLGVLAAVCQALGVVIARPVLSGLSPFQSSFLRLWFPVICLLLWQIAKSKPNLGKIKELTKSKAFFALTGASVLGTFLGLTLMMKGLEHSPLGVALALNSTYPIWILVGERFFGVSKLRPVSNFLILGSVAGIWLMI